MDKLLDFLQKEANVLRSNAGYSGSMNDGGARELENQIKVWMAGRAGRVPSCWDIYVKKYNRETDPEFADYIRLKGKFG